MVANSHSWYKLCDISWYWMRLWHFLLNLRWSQFKTLTWTWRGLSVISRISAMWHPMFNSWTMNPPPPHTHTSTHKLNGYSYLLDSFSIYCNPSRFQLTNRFNHHTDFPCSPIISFNFQHWFHCWTYLLYWCLHDHITWTPSEHRTWSPG